MFTNQPTESDENKAEQIANLCMEHAVDAAESVPNFPVMYIDKYTSDVVAAIRKAFEASD